MVSILLKNWTEKETKLFYTDPKKTPLFYTEPKKETQLF